MLKRTPKFESLVPIYTRVKDKIASRTIQPDFPIGLSALDTITRGFPKGKISIIASRSSEGKCQMEGSLVPLANGDIIPIEEVKISDYVLGLDYNSKIIPMKVFNKICDGKKDVYEVKTQLGKVSYSTSSHPFLTLGGWKNLKGLRVGDKIAIPRRLNFGKAKISDERARLLGYLIAEGTLSKGSILFSQGDVEVVKDFKRCLKSVFPELRLNQMSKYDYRITEGKGSGSGYSNRLIKYITSNNLRCKSYGKNIPQRVMKLNKEAISEFLKALFSGDGSIYKRAEKWVLEYSSSSEILVRGVEKLLLKFGIISSFQEKITNFGTRAFILRINQYESINIFLKEIGFVGEKSKRVISVAITQKSNVDNIPQEVWQYIRSEYSYTEIQKAIGYSKEVGLGSGTYKRGIGRERLLKISKRLNDGYLYELATNDIVWVGIKSINFMGRKKVWDLEIETYHNFICEGMIVHNTSFAIQSAVHLANLGKTVAFISLEDDRETLVEKILCNLFEIDNYELGKGKIEKLEKYESTIKHLFERLTLLVLDAYGYNFMEFNSVVMNLSPKPDIVFVDYLQVLEYAEGKQTEVISTFLRNAHQLALQQNIGIVLNSQVNRGGAEAKRPHLHNMKQAGTIEEIAYLLLILHMNYKHGDPSWDYDKRLGKGMEHCPTDYMEVMVEKNKIGRCGIIPLRFTGNFYKFAERDDVAY